MKQIFFITLFLLISCKENQSIETVKDPNVYSIGFGSCLTQERSMPIFNSIKAENYDLFLMLGDNVYGDSEREDLLELREAYDMQRQNFDSFNFNFPFEAIWDDHDYGLNDAGKEYAYKEDAEQLFLDFWNISEDDVRRKRPGLYFEWIEDINGITVQMLFLDTRFFRDALLPTDERGAPGKERYVPQTDTSTSMLGEVQWSWLEQKMAKEVDHRIIVSSIQFLAMGHGWEAWKTMPHERQRLIDLIDESSSDSVLFISGDRHRGGLYKFTSNSGKNIVEMTSSSLNLSFTNDEESGPLRVGPTFVQENYGEILLNKMTKKLTVNLKDNQGQIIQSVELLKDKTAVAHWAPPIGGQFWWNGIFFVLIFVPFMLFIGRKLSSKQRDYVLYGMGAYQLIKVLAVQISHILSDNYILATHLPLQLCGMSGILAGVVVFYRKQLLFEFLYYFGIVGFIHSILTPEFTGGTSSWNVFDYYVGHSMLLIVPAWLMIYYDQRLRHNAWWKSFIYLQLLVVLVSQANSIIGNGANYMYLAKAPIADNPLVLQDPYHIIGFEIFAIIHFYILDIIARRIFDK